MEPAWWLIDGPCGLGPYVAWTAPKPQTETLQIKTGDEKKMLAIESVGESIFKRKQMQE